MKKIILLVSVYFCISCDPMDARLKFHNNSSNNVCIRALILKNGHAFDTFGAIMIEEGENKTVGTRFNWDSKFENSKPDSILKIIVIAEHELISYNKISHSKEKIDSLINGGYYFYKDYSYGQLQRKKWKINYPEDGFIKGDTLSIDY